MPHHHKCQNIRSHAYVTVCAYGEVSPMGVTSSYSSVYYVYMIPLNTPAPQFSLADQTGKIHKLSDYKGKWVLVYFYPKDDTPGCTIEACTIRDNMAGFEKANAVVLGISADSPESHAKFAQKYNLPFTLLADESKEVVKAYDSWAPKKMFGKEFLGIKRNSFLINPEGILVKVYEGVKPQEHAEEVLQDMATQSKN